ncbi:MAG: glycosyltransferase family 4 protein [Candidatus Woesebacteria bacterium]
MKILILTDYYPPDKIGGVGEIAKNLKESYQAKGHEVWVLTTGQAQDDPKVIRSSKSLIKGAFLNNLRALKIIKQQKIDVINLHQSSTTLFLLAKLFNERFPKIINSFQVSYFSEFAHIKTVKVKGKEFKPARKEHIEKWVFSPVHVFLGWIGYVCADEVTVVSSENKKEFMRTYNMTSSKNIKIIANGVNPGNFTPGKPRLDQKFLDQLAGKTALLYVGVFRARKRVFNLLFALQKVVKINSNVVLVLVGGGRDYEADILKLIDDLGLKKHVIFVGKVPNTEVVNYLRVCDVFCTLSSYEGMPIAILEAMASGKAILTSKASGMIDLIDDGKDGYLTDVDNIDQIAQKMQLLVDNPKKTKQMGEQARKKILQSYNWNDIADKYIKLF